MKTFVISLKRSKDRRLSIQKLLDEAGIDFEFFDAIDAAQPNFKYSERRAPDKTKIRFGYHLVESELACFASHLSIWKRCLELNEPILVLEDNIQITPEFLTHFESLETITNKYQLVKLCALHPKKHRIIESLKNQASIVHYRRSTCGTQGYSLTPHAAAKLISQATFFIEPVDNYIEKPWRHNIFVYCFMPNLINRADIQSTIGSSRKDKTGLKLYKKIYIETFRVYEQIREKITRY